MAKFRIKVTDERGREWWEDYDKSNVTDVASAQTAGKNLIESFNNTLRPGEKARTLLAVELGGQAKASHDWEKQNLVTEHRGDSFYDRMKCKRCGATGKRYGLEGVKRDTKFKARKWEVCPNA